MKRISDNKVVLVIFSIVVALAFWLAVDQGTTVTKTFDNVRVEYVGEETTLASRGLMLIKSDTVSNLTLEVEGSRGDVAAIDPEDVRVVVDLNTVTSVGTQSLNYRTVYTDNSALATRLRTKSFSSNIVTISVGELYRKSVEIRCDMSGTSVAEGFIAGEITTDPELLEIWGRQSDVMSVSYAEVKLNVEEATETVVQVLEYELYDSHGELVESVNIHRERDEIQVTLPVDMVKELPLKVIFEEAVGYRESNVICVIEPAVVQVYGDAAVLSGVNTLILDTIALNEIQGTEIFHYPIRLPERCESLDGASAAKVTIRFRDITSRQMQIPSDRFEIENIPEGKTVNMLTTSLGVNLRGTSSDLNALTEEDIRIKADLSHIQGASGNYAVSADITVGKGDVAVLGTYQLKLNLSDAGEDLPGDMTEEVPAP